MGVNEGEPPAPYFESPLPIPKPCSKRCTGERMWMSEGQTIHVPFSGLTIKWKSAT